MNALSLASSRLLAVSSKGNGVVIGSRRCMTVLSKESGEEYKKLVRSTHRRCCSGRYCVILSSLTHSFPSAVFLFLLPELF